MPEPRRKDGSGAGGGRGRDTHSLGAGTLDVFSRMRSTRRGFLRRSDLFWLLILFFSSGPGRKESSRGLRPPHFPRATPHPLRFGPTAAIRPASQGRRGPRLAPGFHLGKEVPRVSKLCPAPPLHPFPGPPGNSPVLGTERGSNPQPCPLRASRQGRKTRNANEKEGDQGPLRPRELNSGPKMAASQHDAFPPSLT